MITDLHDRLERLVWGDVLEKRGLPGRILAAILRHVYAVLRDLFSGQLTLRAMSLVYTTLLSIVPLLAFSFSVLKGLGVQAEIERQLYRVLEPLGDTATEYRGYIEQLFNLVENVNGKALAGFGLAFFLYTVISMVQKTEESFNYVWYVNKPRSFTRRFVEYLFVLLVGPLSMFIALSMIATLSSSAAVEFLLENRFVDQTFTAIAQLAPYMIVCAVFTFLYMFMPNTRVRLSSALVGGIVGGVLWATSSILFATFVVGSANRNAIYASFAIPISGLIWVYINWLVLLIGSQLAFYHQNPSYLRIGRRDPKLSNSMRERLALNVMLLTGSEFRNPGGGITLNALAEKLKIPSLTLAPIVADLEDAGLITVTERECLQPAREMSRITLNEILRIVRVTGETGSYRSPEWSSAIDTLGNEIDDAVANTVGETTLTGLLDRVG